MFSIVEHVLFRKCSPFIRSITIVHNGSIQSESMLNIANPIDYYLNGDETNTGQYVCRKHLTSTILLLLISTLNRIISIILVDIHLFWALCHRLSNVPHLWSPFGLANTIEYESSFRQSEVLCIKAKTKTNTNGGNQERNW